MAKRTLLPFLVFIFVFFLSLQVITDTDFGWHLSVGQYIVNTKTIPKSDLFSFSQPNYPYVYHSWAGEVLVFASYKLLGFAGVSIFYSLIITLSLFFLYRTSQILTKQINPLLFLWATPIAYALAGGRMRVFTFLFLSLLYYLFLKYQRQNSKLIWLTPAIFALWVNFHGSFILGIAVFASLILSLLFSPKTKQLVKIKILPVIFAFSLLATLINPYFLRAWQQAITMSINSSVALNITKVNPDWQSLFTPATGGWSFALIILVFVIILFFFKNKINTSQRFLMLLFFFLALFTSRFAIALFVFFLPAANQFIAEFKNRLPKPILASISIRTATLALFLILFLTSLSNLLEINFAYSSYKNYASYLAENSYNKFLFHPWPYEASLFIEENLKDRKILNNANWGNFMILLNPQRKVFYWGAMDNFIVNGRSFAFEYLDIVQIKPNWEEKIKQYQIDAVFLQNDAPLVTVLKLKPDWQVAYQDNSSIIMLKN